MPARHRPGTGLPTNLPSPVPVVVAPGPAKPVPVAPNPGSPTPAGPAPVDSAPRTIIPAALSAAAFHDAFTPLGTSPAMESAFQSSSVSGVVVSEAFQGAAAATGLYAYAYQVRVTGGALNGFTTSLPFDDTPVGTALAGPVKVYAYVVSDGPAGGLATPQPGSATSGVALAWRVIGSHGSLDVSFGGSLNASATSVTVVVISNAPPSQQFLAVPVAGPSGIATELVSVYSPQPGSAQALPQG